MHATLGVPLLLMCVLPNLMSLQAPRSTQRIQVGLAMKTVHNEIYLKKIQVLYHGRTEHRKLLLISLEHAKMTENWIRTRACRRL